MPRIESKAIITRLYGMSKREPRKKKVLTHTAGQDLGLSIHVAVMTERC